MKTKTAKGKQANKQAYKKKLLYDDIKQRFWYWQSYISQWEWPEDEDVCLVQPYLCQIIHFTATSFLLFLFYL